MPDTHRIAILFGHGNRYRYVDRRDRRFVSPWGNRSNCSLWRWVCGCISAIWPCVSYCIPHR